MVILRSFILALNDVVCTVHTGLIIQKCSEQRNPHHMRKPIGALHPL